MSAELEHLVQSWPVPWTAAAVVGPDGVLDAVGPGERIVRIASISKTITTLAGLVAIEEGTIGLDEPAGRPGATVRHLLAHAAGYDFDRREAVAAVGTRRVYSNVGIEVFAELLASRAGMPFDRYLAEAVFEPLGMTNTTLAGSPAHGVHSSVEDLSRYVSELLRPTLVGRDTLAEATTPQFPDLAGVLPGVGRFDPNPWGLGFEIKGEKDPHWSGHVTSPGTFGHFGGSGTFLWVDPSIGVGCVSLSDREFGPWAMQVWPPFSDRVASRFATE